MTHPLRPRNALDLVGKWFGYPHITPVNPGTNHPQRFRASVEATGVAADLVTDAHIASFAMEYQAEMHSNNTDFGRLPALRWVNPL